MKMSEYMAESIIKFSELLEDENKIKSINLVKIFIKELIDCYSQILEKNENVAARGFIHPIIDCYISDIYDVKALDYAVTVLSWYEKMDICDFLNKEVKFKL